MASEKIAHSRWVVDSIEESMASIEVDGETMVTVPLAMLPEAARQGHVLRVTIEVDTTGTKKALDESAAQVNKGAARQADDPGGDITL